MIVMGFSLAHHRFPPNGTGSPGTQSPCTSGASLMRSRSHYPAEFSRLVVSYAPCTGEKINLTDASTFITENTAHVQSGRPIGLSIDCAESCPRQRHDDAVLLNRHAEPDGFSHPCSLASTRHRPTCCNNVASFHVELASLSTITALNSA